MWKESCSEFRREDSVKTVAAWITKHPGINALAFEGNSDKSFGFGEWEEVCGFCLASHYFNRKAPEFCQFCRAQLRETRVISDLPLVTSRIYQYRFNSSPTVRNDGPKLRIVPNDRLKTKRTKLRVLDF